MNQQKTLIRIAELLSRFKIETTILNSNAQLDINIVAEDILIPILNIAYNCKLENAKYSESDAKFPALDLLDKQNRIAFQVTSTSTITKIRKTIEGIVKNKFYQQFDTFFIYIITQKQKSYDKKNLETATQGIFSFPEKNILDERDLFKKVASLPYPKMLEVEKILEQQFSDVQKNETKIQKDLEKIITKIKLDSQDQFLITEIEGSYKIRETWLNKKMFLENKLPTISDPNQQFSLFVQIEEINKQIENYNNQISNLLIQTQN